MPQDLYNFLYVRKAVPSPKQNGCGNWWPCISLMTSVEKFSGDSINLLIRDLGLGLSCLHTRHKFVRGLLSGILTIN